jgi:hypothetical protein
MQKNQPRVSPIKVAGIVTVVAVVLVAGVLVFRAQQTKSNTEYFNELTLRTKSYYGEQAKAVGMVSSDADLVKRCYISDQVASGGGHLWCAITVTKKATVEPDEAKLQAFVDSLEVPMEMQGFSVTVHGAGDLIHGFSVEAAKNESSYSKICSVDAEYVPHARLPDATTSVRYNLRCDHASSGLVPGFIDGRRRV